MRFHVSILLLILFEYIVSPAQQLSIPPPKREVRAVWITTASGLDWPHSLDRNEQQSSLEKIVRDLKSAHFNTIFFQVRARGDAYYKSSYEPWAENMTGTLGRDPGWDPLAFLLTHAHRLGIEVHAWFNVYKIQGPLPVGHSSPPHPGRAHPRWVVQTDGESWLDPGIPGVRTYLLRVALELVRLYDIDGIHFDFIRYPSRDFPDGETYRQYGNGKARDDWRRSNINRFVTEFYDSAIALKPMLKVGSAPIGIYKGVKNGDPLGAYHSYFQDSEGWIRQHKHDYLAPQVYWDIGSSPGDPDFALLAREWQQSSGGRHIYIGIGAYKPGVSRELPAEIDTTRACGAAGQAFFRLGNIQPFEVLGNRYHTLANIPPMTWKDSIPPLPPSKLVVSETATNIFRLRWTPPEPAKDGECARYYDIYRSTSPFIQFDDPTTIAAITPSDDCTYVDTINTPGAPAYYYAVTAFDKGHNESAPSAVVSGVVKEMLALSSKLSNVTSLSISLARDDDIPALVAFTLAERTPVSVDVFERRRDSADKLAATLMRGVRDGGTYVLGIRKEQFKPGSYIIRLTAADTTLDEPVELGD